MKHQSWPSCSLSVTVDPSSLPFKWTLILCHVRSGTTRSRPPRDRGWVFRLNLPPFFKDILFFWKLVSHGGLDFSIFVSSTIWNQCFRSKNCSTAKGPLRRSCCSWDWLPFLLPESVRDGGNLKSKVNSWVCRAWKGDGVGRGRVWRHSVWAGERFWHSVDRYPQSPVSRAFEHGDGHCWLGYLIVVGKGRGLRTWRTVWSASALSACSWMPWNSRPHLQCSWYQTCHLHCQGAGPPGAPLDPSLTQADRFLLVFRVCFCLAPFEIGYDVGGKAAAAKPHAKSAQQQPVGFLEDGWAECGEGRPHFSIPTSLRLWSFIAQVGDDLMDF